MLDWIPEPARGVLWGLKHSAVRWFVNRGFAEALHVELQRVLASGRVRYLIDVGANTGQYVRLARRLGYAGPIVSFEPISELAEALKRDAIKDGRWTVVGCALGDVEGPAEINVATDTVFSSLRVPSEFGRNTFARALSEMRKQEVVVRRLDGALVELLGDNPDGMHLKIDTQGYEMPVLLGAGTVLRGVASMQVELSFSSIYEDEASYLEILSFMEGSGFGLSALSPIVRHPMDGSIVEADALFVRRAPGHVARGR